MTEVLAPPTLQRSTLNQISMDATNSDTTVQTKKVLFVTNSEIGQANTILAMALEATTRPNLEVHIASFPVLKRRIEKLSPKINFHPLDGKAMVEMASVHNLSEETFSHPPTTKSWEPYGLTFSVILTGWDGECTSRFLLLPVWAVIDVRRLPGLAYVRICESIKKIIQGINPDIIVIDSLFNAGFDACYSLNRRFVMNSPNTPTDIERFQLPWLKGFWYYPVFVLSTRLSNSH